MNNTLQFAIYKGTGGKFGAAQFNFQPPHYYKGKQKDFDGTDVFEFVDGKRRMKEGWKVREGAVFLEVTSAKDKNVYDWENKIILALSITDMGKVLLTLLTGNECKIMHDPGAKSQSQGAVKKYLNISSPNGPVKGVMMSVTQTAGGEKRSHTVPVTGDEVVVLKNLLDRAITRALNW